MVQVGIPFTEIRGAVDWVYDPVETAGADLVVVLFAVDAVIGPGCRDALTDERLYVLVCLAYPILSTLFFDHQRSAVAEVPGRDLSGVTTCLAREIESGRMVLHGAPRFKRVIQTNTKSDPYVENMPGRVPSTDLLPKTF